MTKSEGATGDKVGHKTKKDTRSYELACGQRKILGRSWIYPRSKESPHQARGNQVICRNTKHSGQQTQAVPMVTRTGATLIFGVSCNLLPGKPFPQKCANQEEKHTVDVTSWPWSLKSETQSERYMDWWRRQSHTWEAAPKPTERQT